MPPLDNTLSYSPNFLLSVTLREYKYCHSNSLSHSDFLLLFLLILLVRGQSLDIHIFLRVSNHLQITGDFVLLFIHREDRLSDREPSQLNVQERPRTSLLIDDWSSLLSDSEGLLRLRGISLREVEEELEEESEEMTQSVLEISDFLL